MTTQPPAEPVRALWSPYWFDGDQALALGTRKEDWFFTPTPREAVERGFALQFHCGFADEGTYEARDTTILRIEHPELGDLRSVETALDYTFELADSRRLVVDAEGESAEEGIPPGDIVVPPGVVSPTTWDLTVTLTAGPAYVPVDTDAEIDLPVGTWVDFETAMEIVEGRFDRKTWERRQGRLRRWLRRLQS